MRPGVESAETPRDRILVLVTDGQVGNEDQILRSLDKKLRGVRVFALGIDRAVNEAFLRRLSALGGGHFELVESEDRLDEVMAAVHRQIGTPLLTKLNLEPDGLAVEVESLVPDRLPDLFPGAPVVVLGRYQGRPDGRLTVRAVDAAGHAWFESIEACPRDNPAIAATSARGRVSHARRSICCGKRRPERSRAADRRRLIAFRRAQPVHSLCRHRPVRAGQHERQPAPDHPAGRNAAGVGGRITRDARTYPGHAHVFEPSAGREAWACGAPELPPVDALYQVFDKEVSLEDLCLCHAMPLSPPPMAASAPPPDSTAGGMSLDLVLTGRLPDPHQAARWVAEIAEELQQSHLQGFEWCEITPADIEIGSNGHAVIADPFRLKSAPRLDDAPSGNPAHVAPERLEAKGQIDALDAWSTTWESFSTTC